MRNYPAKIGLTRDYLAHSARATFTATALQNGVQPRDMQNAARRRDPSTMKLCDRLDYNPEIAISFMATY